MNSPSQFPTNVTGFQLFCGKFIEPLAMFEQTCKLGAAAAYTQLAAETLAHSYRGYHVGALVVARNPLTGSVGIFFGGNTQIRPGEHPEKNCAEQAAIAEALAAGYTEIIGIATFAPNQPDNTTGRVSLALPPCWRCRRDFATMDAIPKDTPVVMHGPGGATWRSTTGALVAEYGIEPPPDD